MNPTRWPAQTRQKDDRLCSDEKESIGRTRRLTGLKMWPSSSSPQSLIQNYLLPVAAYCY